MILCIHALKLHHKQSDICTDHELLRVSFSHSPPSQNSLHTLALFAIDLGLITSRKSLCVPSWPQIWVGLVQGVDCWLHLTLWIRWRRLFTVCNNKLVVTWLTPCWWQFILHIVSIMQRYAPLCFMLCSLPWRMYTSSLSGASTITVASQCPKKSFTASFMCDSICVYVTYKVYIYACTLSCVHVRATIYTSSCAFSLTDHIWDGIWQNLILLWGCKPFDSVMGIMALLKLKHII